MNKDDAEFVVRTKENKPKLKNKWVKYKYGIWVISYVKNEAGYFFSGKMRDWSHLKYRDSELPPIFTYMYRGYNLRSHLSKFKIRLDKHNSNLWIAYNEQ
jgi:hypothetical protein